MGIGADASSMRKPHVPQKRNDGGTSLPHDGQRRIAPVPAGGAKPGEKPGTPGGGPIGGCIGGIPGPPSGPEGGIPGMPPGIPPPAVPRGIGAIGWDGDWLRNGPIGPPIPPPSGAPGVPPESAIIVFIMAMSPPGLGAAVSSAPQPRQNL
jgi:hypothetical protein